LGQSGCPRAVGLCSGLWDGQPPIWGVWPGDVLGGEGAIGRIRPIWVSWRCLFGPILVPQIYIGPMLDGLFTSQNHVRGRASRRGHLGVSLSTLPGVGPFGVSRAPPGVGQGPYAALSDVRAYGRLHGNLITEPLSDSAPKGVYLGVSWRLCSELCQIPPAWSPRLNSTWVQQVAPCYPTS